MNLVANRKGSTIPDSLGCSAYTVIRGGKEIKGPKMAVSESWLTKNGNSITDAWAEVKDKLAQDIFTFRTGAT